jgi:hypothetical protein
MKGLPMDEKQIIENVYFFPNGMVAVTDQRGQQIPEYQGLYDEVWPKIQKDLLPTSKIHR